MPEVLPRIRSAAFPQMKSTSKKTLAQLTSAYHKRIDFGKAIRLLLNPFSRPLTFRHIYVLEKIQKVYESSNTLENDINDMIVFMVLCKEVYQANKDQALLTALVNAFKFISAKLVKVPSCHEKLVEMLSSLGDVSAAVVLESVESLVLQCSTEPDYFDYEILASSNVLRMLSDLALSEPEFPSKEKIVALLYKVSNIPVCAERLINDGIITTLVGICDACLDHEKPGEVYKSIEYTIGLFFKLLLNQEESVCAALLNDCLPLINEVLQKTKESRDLSFMALKNDILIILSKVSQYDPHHDEYETSGLISQLLDHIDNENVFQILSPLLGFESMQTAVLNGKIVVKAVELISRDKQPLEVLTFFNSLLLRDLICLPLDKTAQLAYATVQNIRGGKTIQKLASYQLLLNLLHMSPTLVNEIPDLCTILHDDLSLVIQNSDLPLKHDVEEVVILGLLNLHAIHPSQTGTIDSKQMDLLLYVIRNVKMHTEKLVLAAIVLATTLVRAYGSNFSEQKAREFTYAILELTVISSKKPVIDAILGCLCDMLELPAIRACCLRWKSAIYVDIKGLLLNLWKTTQFQTRLFLIAYQLGLYSSLECAPIRVFFSKKVEKAYKKVKEDIDTLGIRPTSPDEYLMECFAKMIIGNGSLQHATSGITVEYENMTPVLQSIGSRLNL